ncbi:citrulline utilization hydrolase CtlX [Rheinheimera sp. MMS21-TC3]|uniref:citrulline utilization hydrolase CtlX n=1 Tax=Rheinheimera sp. MMS21-TC3 TaxID=3072790 RepID=UPI0028C38CF9|nr:arginine deiminase-related protein [Rheinheimera sp. MMS21-TC3]WNO61320.1 arginine deiminase-related protein [Rheinheimera sp. MMS21-TC3]
MQNTVNIQAPSSIVMVRPHQFVSNPQTMADNAFQVPLKQAQSAQAAYDEITAAITALQNSGIEVHVYEDKGTSTPDSVFPNNWFSTHHNGLIISYPMYAENRRLEYRQDIIDFLQNHYNYEQFVDLRHYTFEDKFLEGTGSIVFDHQQKLAYAVQSKRTDPELLDIVCKHLGYQAVVFNASDEKNIPVYHTNVLMCLASDYVMIGMDMVDTADQARLYNHFNQAGLTVIELSNQQIHQFCGNAIELQSDTGSVLALSRTAYNALNQEQRSTIAKYSTLLPLDVPTIEAAGGSVRCMIAGVHY